MENTKNYYKKRITENGVKNIKEYGYLNVTTENIMTDEIYSAFFESMLESNLGQNADFDIAIRELLSELHKS